MRAWALSGWWFMHLVIWLKTALLRLSLTCLKRASLDQEVLHPSWSHGFDFAAPLSPECTAKACRTAFDQVFLFFILYLSLSLLVLYRWRYKDSLMPHTVVFRLTIARRVGVWNCTRRRATSYFSRCRKYLARQPRKIYASWVNKYIISVPKKKFTLFYLCR